jgi:hypothetical protein
VTISVQLMVLLDDPIQFGRYVQTFQTNVLPSSPVAWVEDGALYQSAQCHFSDNCIVTLQSL